MGTSRREFLKTSSKVLAAAGTASLLPGKAFSILSGSPNEQINVGLIGCNGMGWTNLMSFLRQPNVKCLALCDVDQNVLEKRASELEKESGTKANLFTDYRKLLEDKDIDAVIVATPDHWHCLQMVHACEAGKDVYVEKPVGRTVRECEVMTRVARKYDRVVQAGQWQRSGPHWKDAVEYVKSGDLGNIRVVKTWAYQGWMDSIPVKPDANVPAGVDYDMWLGPAPERPFNPNRFHFNFRWFWDYAGGLMTDWGVHLIDIALFGMNVAAPVSVMSTGGKFGFPDDAMETPDTQQAIYEFDGFSMIWEHGAGINNGPYGRDHGVAFIGNNGTLVADRGGWEVIPEVRDEKEKTDPVALQEGSGKDLDLHVQNFLECIKSRNEPACDIAIASNTAVCAALGNAAYLTGEKLYWDSENAQFRDKDEANALLSPTYRDPWALPEI